MNKTFHFVLKFSAVILLHSILFSALSAKAESLKAQHPPSMTYEESISYQLGRDVGLSVKKMLPNVVPDAFIRGLASSISGKPSELTRKQEIAIKLKLANKKHQTGGEDATFTKQEIDLETTSYALGLDIGRSAKKTLANPHFNSLAKGVADAIQGKASPLQAQQGRQVSHSLAQRKELSQSGNLSSNQSYNDGENFLQENSKKPNIHSTQTGLQYLLVKEGSGPKPAMKDRVKIAFTASLLNGKRFDSSEQRGSPAYFYIKNLITGLKEGITLMKVGSIYKFFIRPELAYGSKGVGKLIPPFSTLIYEIELLAIDTPEPKQSAGKTTPFTSIIDWAECSFDTYRNAAKCYLTLWTNVKPISEKDEFESMCKGSVTQDFFQECMDIFQTRLEHLNQLAPKSAAFKNYEIINDDEKQSSISISFDQTLLTDTNQELRSTITMGLSMKLENNLWKVNSCNIQQ